ncbi:hypothetical protein DFH06DRAFT_1211113 [Mycena polygramma]|nr:hypothetical protein DFH06DRAFT_1211113 [Mycena polygramma]
MGERGSRGFVQRAFAVRREVDECHHFCFHGPSSRAPAKLYTVSLPCLCTAGIPHTRSTSSTVTQGTCIGPALSSTPSATKTWARDAAVTYQAARYPTPSHPRSSSLTDGTPSQATAARNASPTSVAASLPPRFRPHSSSPTDDTLCHGTTVRNASPSASPGTGVVRSSSWSCTIASSSSSMHAPHRLIHLPPPLALLLHRPREHQRRRAGTAVHAWGLTAHALADAVVAGTAASG